MILCPFYENSWSAKKIFEVRHVSTIGEKFVVNVDSMESNCRKWSITSMPCCHFLTAMNFLNLSVEQYIAH